MRWEMPCRDRAPRIRTGGDDQPMRGRPAGRFDGCMSCERRARADSNHDTPPEQSHAVSDGRRMPNCTGLVRPHFARRPRLDTRRRQPRPACEPRSRATDSVPEAWSAACTDGSLTWSRLSRSTARPHRGHLSPRRARSAGSPPYRIRAERRAPCGGRRPRRRCGPRLQRPGVPVRKVEVVGRLLHSVLGDRDGGDSVLRVDVLSADQQRRHQRCSTVGIRRLKLDRPVRGGERLVELRVRASGPASPVMGTRFA